jgi:hypothetical protein
MRAGEPAPSGVDRLKRPSWPGCRKHCSGEADSRGAHPTHDRCAGADHALHLAHTAWPASTTPVPGSHRLVNRPVAAGVPTLLRPQRPHLRRRPMPPTIRDLELQVGPPHRTQDRSLTVGPHFGEKSPWRGVFEFARLRRHPCPARGRTHRRCTREVGPLTMCFGIGASRVREGRPRRSAAVICCWVAALPRSTDSAESLALPRLPVELENASVVDWIA